jgi:DNA-nicking Smr family endonuclease
MSRDGGKPGKTGRHVTPDEAALWSLTTQAVERVTVKPRVAATQAAEPAPAAPRPAGPEPARAKRRSAAPPKIEPARSAAAPGPAAPVAEFERRTLRKVATGKVGIDATLDLHGLQRSDAHARLRAFLRNSQAAGHRMLLVITGKGGEEETGDHLARSLGRPERGILRRKVPQWLEEPEFRAVVLSYTAAGLRHGGSGALYVRLRKARGN